MHCRRPNGSQQGLSRPQVSQAAGLVARSGLSTYVSVWCLWRCCWGVWVSSSRLGMYLDLECSYAIMFGWRGGGWLRAFINPINFLIDSALTFESISIACVFPACYRPILPAGLAYQVIFKTNNTASLWRKLFPQWRSPNKQATKTTSNKVCFVCFVLFKRLLTGFNATPGVAVVKLLAASQASTGIVQHGDLCPCSPERPAPALVSLRLPSVIRKETAPFLRSFQICLSMEVCKSQQIPGLHFPGFLLDEVGRSRALPSPRSRSQALRTQQPGLLPKPQPATPCCFLSPSSHGSAAVRTTYGKGFSGLRYVPVLSQNASIHLHSLHTGIRKTDSLLPSRRRIRNARGFYLIFGNAVREDGAGIWWVFIAFFFSVFLLTKNFPVS